MRGLKSRGWVLEVSVGVACALIVFAGLEFSAGAPGERRAVETLEAQVARQSRTPLPSVSLADRNAARRLCAGSLARAMGDLEQSAPRRAREAGVDNLKIRLKAPVNQGGLFAAPVELTFEGPTPRLGVQLARLGSVAPSVFLDKVEVTPTGEGRNEALMTISGRLVCARP
jgi:hypothetical protein